MIRRGRIGRSRIRRRGKGRRSREKCALGSSWLGEHNEHTGGLIILMLMLRTTKQQHWRAKHNQRWVG
jgi:hypothetical protein